MANRYARTAGGNWTDNATWSTTSGGAADTVAPTASDDVFLDANSGNVTISAASVGKSLTCTGYTGTLTHNAFVLTISGSVTLVAGMTYTPLATSTLAINATSTLTTGGKLLPNLSLSNGQTTTLGDNLTFMDSKTVAFQSSGAVTFNMNGKSINGFSSTSRVLIKSATLGSAATITNATTSFTNADFRDITFSSATDLDLSAITGLSGDCGGNTITGGGTVLTFTTAATQTATGNSANWSAATWSGRVPLPQDDVVLSLTAGQTLTADMPRLGKSISATTAMNLTLGNAVTNYGSLDLTNINTFSGTQVWTFEGRSTFSLTSSGKSFASSFSISMIGGTLNLNDAVSCTVANNGNPTITDGTFNDNEFSLTASRFNVSGSATRRINKSGTWTLDNTNVANVWNATTTTNLTFVDSGTILISNIGANANTFIGGGLTYNNLSISGGGTGAVIITGSNTFATLPQVTGGTKTIQLTSGTTQTITDASAGFGNGTNVITLNAVTGGTAATLTCVGKNIYCDYLAITDITAAGTGSAWFAGANSTSGTGNSGWIWRANAQKLREQLLDKPTLTFFKEYNGTSSVNADYSVGSQTGTMTVTRASGSPGTYVDSSGVIRLMAATDNTPRFTQGFYDSTGFVSRPGLIVEGASTNMLKDSYFSILGGTNWTNFSAGGTVTASTDYTSNYAPATQVLKLVADTALYGFVGTNLANRPTVTSGVVYTVSVTMRGTGDVYIYFRSAGGVEQYSSKITLTNTSWKKYQATFTADATGDGITGIRLQENQAVTMYASTIQLEALPFATTFIPTTTAALQRNAESLTYPISGNRTAATESIFVKFTPEFNYSSTLSADSYLFSTDTVSGARSMRKVATANNFIRTAFDTAAAFNNGTSPLQNTSYVFADIFNGETASPNVIAYLNGVADGNTDTNYTAPVFGTDFRIGNVSGPNNWFFGIISSIAIFSDAKSAADVLDITRYLNGVVIGQQNYGYYPGPQFATFGLF